MNNSNTSNRPQQQPPPNPERPEEHSPLLHQRMPHNLQINVDRENLSGQPVNLHTGGSFQHQNSVPLGEPTPMNLGNTNTGPIRSALLRRDSAASSQIDLKRVWINRQININGKLIVYKGPNHPQINDLIDILEERKESNSSVRCWQSIKQGWASLEEAFKRNCTLNSLRIAITPYDVLIALGFLIICIVFMVQSFQLASKSEVESTSWKSTIAVRVPYFGLGFTLFTICFIHVQNLFVHLLFFAGLVLVPVSIILLYHLNLLNWVDETPEFDLGQILNLGGQSAVYLLSLVMNCFYQWLRLVLPDIFSTLANIGLCFLLPYFIIFNVYYYILTETNYIALDMTSNITALVFIPFIILVVFLWILIQIRMFELPVSVIKAAIQKILKKLMNRELKPVPLEQENHLSRLAKYTNRIASTFIGVLFCTLESVCFVIARNEVDSDSPNYQLIVTCCFEMIAIPTFIVLGVCISASQLETSNTFLYIPIILGAIPIFGLITAEYFLRSVTYLNSALGQLLIIGPVSVCIFWLTMALLGVERRRAYIICTTYVCFFFALPLGFMMPIIESGYSIYEWLVFTSNILLFIGVLGFALVFLVKVILLIRDAYVVKREKGELFNLGSLVYVSLHDCGYWFNSVCFLAAYFFISYFFWNAPNGVTPDERGTLFALMVLHPLLFILINVALRSPSLEIDEENEQEKELEEILQEQHLEQERIKTLRTYQLTFVSTCTIIPLASLLPVSFLMSSRSFRTFLIGIAIGLPALSIVFYVLAYVKNQSKLYANFTQPSIMIAGWLCIFFPFGVVVPIVSIYIANTTEDFENFVQITVVSGLLICLFGVTTISIFFKILINKEEYEKMMRYVTQRIMPVFLDNAVRCDLTTTSLIFVSHMKHNNLKQTQQKLLNKDPVYYLLYPGEDLRYENELVTKSRYERHEKLADMRSAKLLQEEAKKKKVQQQKNPCIECLLDCLFCRCGLDVLSQLQKEKEEELLTLQRLMEVEDEETQQLIRLQDLMPDAFNEAYQMQATFIGKSILEAIELEPQRLLLKQEQKYIPFDQLESSKTPELKALEDKALDSRTKKRLQMTEHGISLKKYKDLLSEFLHVVFIEFSNTDANDVPVMVYADLREMFRLSNIISRDGQVVDRDILNNTPVDVNEISKDVGLITENELKDMYKQCATQLWNNQSTALNERDFAKLLILLMDELNENQGNTFDLLHEFTVEFFYPNLLHNVHTLVLAFKPSNRAFMQSIWKYDPMKSPFAQGNFDQIQEVEGKELIAGRRKKLEQLMKLRDQEDPQPQQNVSVLTQPQPKAYDIQKQQIEEKYEKKLSCCQRCCYSCARCLRNIFWVYPKRCCMATHKLLFGPPIQVQEKLPINKTRQMQKTRAKMPFWQDLVADVIKELDQSIKDYLQLKQDEAYKLELNLSNIIAIQGRFSDIYGLAVIAFNENINWFNQSSSSGDAAAGVTSGESFFSSFEFYFFIAFSLSLLYGVLGVNAAQHSKNNTLGVDEYGNRANFPHRQFFLTKAVGILGSSLFMLFMTTYIDTFVCNFDTYPYKMQRAPTYECLGDMHYLLMGLTLLGLGIYYPLSTFLFPDFQYGDKSLDLKYKSTFLILYVQGKLLILGVGNFFTSFTGGNIQLALKFQMGFSSFIMGLLIFIYARMWPCYVKWFNFLEISLLIIVLGLYSGGLTILLTGDFIYGWIVVGSIVVLVIVCLFLANKYMKRQGNDDQSKVRKINQVLPDNIPGNKLYLKPIDIKVTNKRDKDTPSALELVHKQRNPRKIHVVPEENQEDDDELIEIDDIKGESKDQARSYSVQPKEQWQDDINKEYVEARHNQKQKF